MNKFNEEDRVDHDSVAGIIRQGDKYLVMHHVKHDMITVPVGKVKPDETIMEGLINEMFEEVGIEVNEAHEVGSFATTYDFTGKPVKINTHIFVIDDYRGEIANREPDKAHWVRWMTMDEIKALNRRISYSLDIYDKLFKDVDRPLEVTYGE